MRGKKAKQLRKTLLNKTAETLLLLRNEVGESTKNMTETAIWKCFKRLYKNNKVPQSFLIKNQKTKKGEVK